MTAHTGQLASKPTCPQCRKLLDGFTHLERAESPKKGDLTICCYCMATLAFTKTLKLRHATADEIAEVDDFTELQRNHAAARRAKAYLEGA